MCFVSGGLVQFLQAQSWSLRARDPMKNVSEFRGLTRLSGGNISLRSSGFHQRVPVLPAPPGRGAVPEGWLSSELPGHCSVPGGRWHRQGRRSRVFPLGWVPDSVKPCGRGRPAGLPGNSFQSHPPGRRHLGPRHLLQPPRGRTLGERNWTFYIITVKRPTLY